MAKTYAGYVKRDEGSFIDWGKIGKDFSDQLFEIRKGIVENKRQIQKDDDQFLDQLANNPMTGVTTIDDFTTDMVGKIQNQLLMLNEARERGELGDQAYVQIRQRVTSGYNNVSTLAKNAGVKMNAIREKIARGEAVSKAEIALQEQIENMSNFGKTRYYVDPYDGRSYLAKIEVDENGVPTTRIDKDNLYSVQALNQISQRNVALVDASKIADSIYNKFSKTKIFREYADENGVKKAVEYFFQKDKDGKFANPEAIESLGLTIEQALAQSDVVTSVLVDNQGDYNVNGKLVKSDDPNMINIVSEGGSIQFDVTDKQREAAKDYVMDLVMGRFSDVVKEDALTKYQEETLKLQRQRLALQAQQAARNLGATTKKEKEKRNRGEELYRTYNTMLSDFQKGVSQFRNLQAGQNRAEQKIYIGPDPNAKDTKRRKEGVFVNLTDERIRKFVNEAKEFYPNNPFDQIAYLNKQLTGVAYDGKDLSTGDMTGLIVELQNKGRTPSTNKKIGGRNTTGDPKTGV